MYNNILNEVANHWPTSRPSENFWAVTITQTRSSSVPISSVVSLQSKYLNKQNLFPLNAVILSEIVELKIT